MSDNKRKRIVLTVKEKLDAIQRIDKGESVQKICAELNVGKSTVNDWRRNRLSLQDFCTNVETDKVLDNRKTLKKPTHEMVDDALWLWFMQERRRGTPISGPILKEKAMFFHSKIEGEKEFSASDGWLGRWKKRHGVSFINICGEKMSADIPASNEFLPKLEEIVRRENLLPEQVYNMDETGLNFKRLPQKTFSVGHASSAPGFKLNKERVTVALCSNASGSHKLPLLVIGKSQKPRAFKNINVLSLPVCYRAQKAAWMDSNIFTDWFINEFVPQVKKYLKERKLPEKAILILDNSATHPVDVECEGAPGIKLVFLPSNVTSLIQPMDQGVIESFKRRYRRKFLSEVLGKLDSGIELISAVKLLNIKDVIYMAAQAYDEIPSSTFIKSWRKVWPNIEKDVNDAIEDEQPLSIFNEKDDNIALLNDLRKLSSSDDQIEEENLNEWVTGDDDLENDFFTDDQIVEKVVDEASEIVTIEDSEDDNQEEKISHEEAKNALQLATTYIEQQAVSRAVDVMFMKKWRDYAFKKAIEKKTQKKMTDFFH